MKDPKPINFLKKVLKNMPSDWLKLTTHKLDKYNESLAKEAFLDQFDQIFQNPDFDKKSLYDLPTAYDYIRLGHPLSCILEWYLAKDSHVKFNNIISFASQTAPILAILRNNLLKSKNTRILYTGNLPNGLDEKCLKTVYEFRFELKKIDDLNNIPEFGGSTVLVAEQENISPVVIPKNIDFYINTKQGVGSVLIANKHIDDTYISDIQHFRRRETIAMTPKSCHHILQRFVEERPFSMAINKPNEHKKTVLGLIKNITNTKVKPLVASSGLSMQYAIMMGLVNEAKDKHPTKSIKFIVPPNCYGGTNDQARRIAANIAGVSIVDLPVDSGNNMDESIEKVLNIAALEDSIPYIIAEIPTNPRVEVPDLEALKNALCKSRNTEKGKPAEEAVFILDQTFCPNINFLGEGKILSHTRAISYASGSKFPSGGKCTAGYCVFNAKAEALMPKIEKHLLLCDNEATSFQYEILVNQLPSMLQRIEEAYQNTRKFVNFIGKILPEAKINFVSETLASQGFTPSVFSLDLPTKGKNSVERERYKRDLNLKLIHSMISQIPDESKYCVSYGQLKGVYWTIPATSTQGTTKEEDKDYIARVALSSKVNLDLHQKVFKEFVESM